MGPSRQDASCQEFDLDFTEMNARHHLNNVDRYELGKLKLKDYSDRVAFYEKRPFAQAQFWRFMAVQSKPFSLMIELVREFKARCQLKIAVVSNEARDLSAHRVREFKLNQFVDFFVSSCFVYLRKPNGDMFRYAQDIAQIPAHQADYIEDLAMFVRVAETVGIPASFIPIPRTRPPDWPRLGCHRFGPA